MALVDEHQRVVLVGQVADFKQGGDVSVHAEHPVRNYQPVPVLLFVQVDSWYFINLNLKDNNISDRKNMFKLILSTFTKVPVLLLNEVYCWYFITILLEYDDITDRKNMFNLILCTYRTF